MVNEEFGRKLGEKFLENRKLFWKKVRKERGDARGVSVKMKRENGVLMSSKKKVKGVCIGCGNMY